MSAADLAEVCGIIKSGGIVALPTETVYGLAANALCVRAVEKIFLAKGRPQDNPLIVHIADISELPRLARTIPDEATALAEAFWPGPLTMVLEKSAAVPDITRASLDSVGIRMPSHSVIREIIRAGGTPLAAPSANISGRPSPTTARDCADDLSGRIDAIVDGGACSVGVESTVLSLCGASPRILRPGAITPADIERVLGARIELDSAVMGRSAPGAASSPGMKYKHYAPAARVLLVLGDKNSFCEYVNSRAESGVMALCMCGEEQNLNVPSLELGTAPEQIARALFSALRETDRKGAKTVYAHCPEPDGVGLAVYNRLQRAAAFEVIEL